MFVKIERKAYPEFFEMLHRFEAPLKLCQDGVWLVAPTKVMIARAFANDFIVVEFTLREDWALAKLKMSSEFAIFSETLPGLPPYRTDVEKILDRIRAKSAPSDK